MGGFCGRALVVHKRARSDQERCAQTLRSRCETTATNPGSNASLACATPAKPFTQAAVMESRSQCFICCCCRLCFRSKYVKVRKDDRRMRRNSTKDGSVRVRSWVVGGALQQFEEIGMRVKLIRSTVKAFGAVSGYCCLSQGAEWKSGM